MTLYMPTIQHTPKIPILFCSKTMWKISFSSLSQILYIVKMVWFLAFMYLASKTLSSQQETDLDVNLLSNEGISELGWSCSASPHCLEPTGTRPVSIHDQSLQLPRLYHTWKMMHEHDARLVLYWFGLWYEQWRTCAVSLVVPLAQFCKEETGVQKIICSRVCVEWFTPVVVNSKQPSIKYDR